MPDPKNIVESVDIFSEADLLVQELDNRLSFDALGLFYGAVVCNAKLPIPFCDDKDLCPKLDTCPKQAPPNCGVRG